MFRQTARSEGIESIGYDAKSKILEIEFPGKGIYRYLNVPPITFYGLIGAESKGLYFYYLVQRQLLS